MDNPQEYDVESVTRARVHDKKGKKITWRYYVKWKGYDWDESTWEPTDSFQGGSEHILESFWERIDTGGRDISDATAFRKGEELLVSGPPGRKPLKRKANPAKTPVSPSKNVSSSVGVTISAPLPRKRRRVLSTTDDEQAQSKPKRSVSMGGSKNGRMSARLPVKRRRVSSPRLRKSAKKRLPSAGDSQLDADGETDPDVVEVEDELMQVSAEDPEDDTSRSRHRATASGSANGSKSIAFEDLEHFYSGNPIDIDQPTDEQVEKPGTRPSVESPPPTPSLPPDDVVPDSQGPASPVDSSPDPLFDSPSHFPDEVPEIQGDPVLHHRARVARPLVKLIDTTTLETTNQQTRITTKARLLSNHSTDILPSSGPSHDPARRGRKPGPGRSSSGLIKKNRSSLLTATKGTLKSIKGKFAGVTVERGRPDEIEEVPGAPDVTEGNELVITSWSDEDNVVAQEGQTASNSHPVPPPSGELLELAGPQADPETLPDYEEKNGVAEAQEVEIQKSDSTPAPTEELPNQSLVEVAEEPRAVDDVADVPLPVSEAGQQASNPTNGNSSAPSVDAPPADEAVKKSIELAKEQLFPSTQTSFSSFSSAQPSFRTTIFGPLYQGHTKDQSAAVRNELSTTFKVILRDGVELPLALKDCSEIKAQISDILIGNSSGSKVALFYSAIDALAMVSTLKSDGTARVVLDTSAEMVQQERFSVLLQRFESSHTLIAPVGKEVCVLYSSENADIAEKLGAPKHLRGLSRTLLISHASIENQLAYVAAIMKATAL